MRVQEVNRLGLSQGAARKQIKLHIAWLDNAIDKLDVDITAGLRSSPAWRLKATTRPVRSATRKPSEVEANTCSSCVFLFSASSKRAALSRAMAS